MRFTTTSNDFYDALKRAGRAAPTSSTTPILEGIYARQYEGQLILRATDLTVTVETTLPVEADGAADGPEAAVIPLGRLKKTLKSLPDLPVEIQVDEEFQMEMRTDQGTYEMAAWDGDQFPERPVVDGAFSPLEPALVLSALEKVEFAVAEDDLRPAMEGVYVDGEAGAVVATDGHRLSKVDTEAAGDITEEDVIVTSDVVDLVKRLTEERLSVNVGTDRIAFRCDETFVWGKLIEETYPDYEAVIPSVNEKLLEVETTRLQDAAERANIYASDVSNRAVMTLREDELTLEAEDRGMGAEATEAVPCHFDGGEMTIGFNAEYLQEVLGKTESEQVRFKIGSPKNAVLVRPSDDRSHTMILMPVMLNDHRGV